MGMEPIYGSREMPELNGWTVLDEGALMRAVDIYAVDSEALWHQGSRTENRELAAKMLANKEELFAALMRRYKHGHFGDESLKDNRERGARDIIERLERLLRPSSVELMTNFIKDSRVGRLLGGGKQQKEDK